MKIALCQSVTNAVGSRTRQEQPRAVGYTLKKVVLFPERQKVVDTCALRHIHRNNDPRRDTKFHEERAAFVVLGVSSWIIYRLKGP